MKSFTLLSALLAAGLAAPSVAAPRTVALDVPSMYCEACPITVKKALSRVPGVSSVGVSFEKKQAVVTFDDAKATVDALTRATANAGFPSKPRP
jgi:periplasmic mercuric ion binding protein